MPHEAFYTTVAQVVPVLLIVLVLEHQLRKDVARTRVIKTFQRASVYLGGCTELLAVIALLYVRDDSWLRMSTALGFYLMFVATTVFLTIKLRLETD